MNILFLSRDYPPYLVGGVGTYVCELSRLLAKMGHKVYVISVTKDSPGEYMEEGVQVFRVKPKKIKLWNTLRPRLKGFIDRLEYSFAVSQKINQLVSSAQIDIIESSEARAEGFWYYFFKKNPPLVIKLHTPETVAFKLDQTSQSLDYHLIKLLEEFWLSKAVQKIGLSKAVVDLTARHFSIKIAETPFVPNPVDIELFSPSAERRVNNSPEILYVGRLEFRKGVHTLIRAFGYVQEHMPEAVLTFIGADCGMKPYLLNKISSLRYPSKVNFIDQVPREQLVAYYQSSQLCVVPSIWENYPYASLEAMACGKAVVASEVGGLKEIITDGYDGILFPSGSSRILGEKIVALLKNETLRNKLGLNARLTIEKKYSPEKIAQKTLSVYQNILNKA